MRNFEYAEAVAGGQPVRRVESLDPPVQCVRFSVDSATAHLARAVGAVLSRLL